MSQASAGEKRTLRVLIKADQGGPAEALADALAQLSNAEVSVEVIHRGVGAVTESDILLARAAGAIIVGFHVRPDNNARAAAEREGVDIKLYKVIYDAVNDVRAALEGMTAIVDTSVTTILTAAVLYQYGTGPVQGFAVTLIAGITASLFTAIFVVRTFYLLWLSRSRGAQTLSI